MAFETKADVRVEELRAVLGRVGTAVLTADMSLRLRFANPSAELLLRRDDGLRLVQGRIAARRTSDTQALLAAVSAVQVLPPAGSCASESRDAATKPEPRLPARSLAVSIWRGDGLASYQVVVCGLSDHVGFAPSDRAAVLFVDDLEESDVASPADVSLLRASFGLTAAESRLALRLAAGATLADAADAFGVTQNTVRAQLRAVFEKTGARRQSDLIRLLSGCRTLRLILG
jgi:DNA-binding CsgD family transcriptional regulator